ncbi:condensation domain-containing protein, partial [Kineococcus glutinatus]|uniref:condensation domain-containing protein n=1 Tax=Kineococcus glutinatus TaxID=1070872 RepID=UPI0031EF81AD
SAERVLGAAEDARLQAAARAVGVTAATLVQAGWGLLLGALTGRGDVVFGGVSSGRPADLPGAEDLVGLFVTTTAVRVRVDPAEPVREFLRRVQAEQAALVEHEHVGLRRVQRLTGVRPLFDTLVSVQNAPAAPAGAAGLVVTDAGTADATHYPVALTVEPGAAGTGTRLVLDVRADAAPAGTSAAQWGAGLLERFAH